MPRASVARFGVSTEQIRRNRQGDREVGEDGCWGFVENICCSSVYVVNHRDVAAGEIAKFG